MKFTIWTEKGEKTFEADSISAGNQGCIYATKDGNIIAQIPVANVYAVIPESE